MNGRQYCFVCFQNMVKKITVDQLWQEKSYRVLLDVRTPAEFEQGHIPGAINLPLFTNEERALVGTSYKQQGPQHALKLGLDLVGVKMRSFIETAEKIAPEGNLLIHCWRGGKRSGSMSWLLDMAGFDVKVLEAGYKAYRKHVLENITTPPVNFVVLGGFTGSAKTAVLHRLSQKAEQIIDLEGIAHHKGSAFGTLGETAQPSVEQFENDLFDAVQALDWNKLTWIENESQSIGQVYLPKGFWQKMREAPLIHLEVPLEKRVAHLVEVYACHPADKLRASFEKIRSRLGGQHLQRALEALEKNDFATAAEVALVYYDKTYRHGLETRPSNVFVLKVDEISPDHTSESLITWIKELQHEGKISINAV